MNQDSVVALTVISTALRDGVIRTRLALFIGFLLMMGMLGGSAVAALIGLLIAASTIIEGTVVALQALAS